MITVPFLTIPPIRFLEIGMDGASRDKPDRLHCKRDHLEPVRYYAKGVLFWLIGVSV